MKPKKVAPNMTSNEVRYVEMYNAFLKVNFAKGFKYIEKEANALWNATKKDNNKYQAAMNNLILKSQKNVLQTSIIAAFQRQVEKSEGIQVVQAVRTSDSNASGDADQMESNEDVNQNLSKSNADQVCKDTSADSEFVQLIGNDPNQSQNEPQAGQAQQKVCPPDHLENEPQIGPIQEKVLKALEISNAEIATLVLKNKSEMGTDQDAKSLKLKLAEKQQLEKKLQKLKRRSVYFREYRAKKKEKLVAEGGELPQKRGKPRIEEDQPGLLEAIYEIASAGGSAHLRRRAETINTPQTVDDMVNALRDSGYVLSRTSTYRRLVPRRWNTKEGKRHKGCVDVRLMKAQNDDHLNHSDTKFCMSTINSVNLVASLLGPEEVLYMSVDDKAKVMLGVVAAKKQTAILVTLAHPGSTPDHDFPVSSRHNLIPSATVILEIKKSSSNAVTYGGPLHISIRSGRHCASSADTHSKDYKRLMTNPYLEQYTKINGKIKPVHIRVVDGGPDQSPKSLKVIACAIENFKDFELDALIIMCNAPNRSAFNPIERRFAMLSKKLSGIILPYDTYGSHLNNSRKTIDKDLELKNFAAAGEVLAVRWRTAVYQGSPTFADYVDVVDSKDDNPSLPSPHWFQKHVRSSKYMIQIVKCGNKNCCPPMRSKWMDIVPNRFLDPPLRVSNDKRFKICKPGQEGIYIDGFTARGMNLIKENIQFDYLCPSAEASVQRRTCKKCTAYFGTIATLKYHQKMHTKQYQILDTSSSEQEDDGSSSEPDPEPESDIELDTPIPTITLKTCYQIISQGEVSSDDDEL